MLAHIVLITWGYAAGELGAAPGDVLEPHRRLPRHAARRSPAPLCLVMVVVTSVRAARAPAALRVVAPAAPLRLPRRRPGPAAPAVDRPGVPRLDRPPPSSGGRLWGAAAGAVLVWRVGLPLWRNAAARPAGHLGRAARRDGVVSVYLTGRGLDRLPVEAGQFFTWRFLGRARLDPRPPLLAVRRPGRPQPADHRQGRSATAARASARLRPGTRVLVEGPYGRLSRPAPAPGRRVALIGAGVGITPLRALAEGLHVRAGRRRAAAPLHRPAAVRRASSTSSPASAACRCSGCPAAGARPDSWLGDGVGTGRRPDRAALLGARHRRARRLRLRPRSWTDAVRRTLAAAGLPADQLHVETFGW